MDDARGEETGWDELRRDIGIYLEVLFVLNSSRDKEVWQYIVGVAAHLEYLAVAVLWLATDKPAPFLEYEENLTLGQAARRLREKGLLNAKTIETLQAVARLRNSVVHRGAVYGVTVGGDDSEHARGVYRGSHIFSDPAVLRSLVNDANAAITEMGNWRRAGAVRTRPP